MKSLIYILFFALWIVFWFIPGQIFGDEIIVVQNDEELNLAIVQVVPGQTIMIAPGRYKGGISIKAMTGLPDAWIVIQGLDEQHKPVIYGGPSVLHLADCRYVKLKNLILTGSEYNGINIDDGGDYQTPATNIKLEQIDVYHIGGDGNHDGIKLSGVDQFSVEKCRVIGWGGSAIDMVGCHNGRIDQCYFEGVEGFSQRNGVQAKGGSSDVIVERSFFKRAGRHAVVIGGHTGEPYFRPKGVNYEANNIRISGNKIYESKIPIAWASSLGGRVTYNTIVSPQTAVLRAYQGTKDPYFVPCQKGEFAHNLVVAGERRVVMSKFEKGTLPETFRFHGNAWYSPKNLIINNLPVPEKNGIYQVNPKLKDLGNPEMRSTSGDKKLYRMGADHYQGN